jgi:hypothetical protein
MKRPMTADRANAIASQLAPDIPIVEVRHLGNGWVGWACRLEAVSTEMLVQVAQPRDNGHHTRSDLEQTVETLSAARTYLGRLSRQIYADKGIPAPPT